MPAFFRSQFRGDASSIRSSRGHTDRLGFAISSLISTIASSQVSIARLAQLVTCIAIASHGVQVFPASLSLEEAVQIALTEEPMVLSLSSKAQAYDDLADASLKLPDVNLRTGLMNLPLEHGDFRTEGMTQLGFGLRQVIPPVGKRYALQAKNESLATEKREQMKIRQLEVVRAVRLAWLEAFFQDRALELVQDSRSHFVDLIELARSLYSVGDKNQEDVIKAELELLNLDNRLLNTRQSRDDAYTILSQWLDQHVTESVERKLPNWTNIPSLDQLEVRLLEHPKLEAINALAKSNDDQFDIAKSNLRPMWTVDLGYSYRDGGLPTGDSRSDLVSAVVSFSWPLWGSEKHTKQMSAAVMNKQSAMHERDLILRNLKYELTLTHSRWGTLTERIQLYDSGILQKARDHARATLVAYKNEKATMSEVTKSYIVEINTALDYERIIVDRARAWAVIDSLVDL